MRSRPGGVADEAEAGFSLLELLVVLGVLALLFALVYPQTLRYLGSARTETAKGQINAIAAALEVYAMDNGAFPTQQQGLLALTQPPPGARAWRGPYLKQNEGLIDPWGRLYLYRIPGRSTPYEIQTLGRDNASGGAGEDQDLAFRQ